MIPRYDAGNAKAFARRADEQPVLLPALVGFQRDILVSHIGRDEWRAFEANPAGRGRRCQVRWRTTTRDFRAPCTGAVLIPLDGTGLKQYSATVNKADRLIIDLRTEVTTTTVTPTSARMSAAAPDTLGRGMRLGVVILPDLPGRWRSARGDAPRSWGSTTHGPTTTWPGARSATRHGSARCRRSLPRRRQPSGSDSARWSRRPTSATPFRSRPSS